MKKLLAIIGIVIVLAVAGWYFFFHRSITVALPGSGGGNPFGTAPDNVPGSTGSGNPSTNSSSTSSTTLGSAGTTTVPTLFKVSSDPVAGGVVYLNKQKQEMIRYIDRSSGHIYEVNPANLVKTEIVNTTAPKIYDALWKQDGSGLIIRTLASDEDTTKNISLVLVPPKATTTGAEYSVDETELRGAITSPVLSGASLAYVLKDSGTIGISGFAGEKPTSVYTSAFNEWQLAWTAGANLVLTTNASRTADGFAYLLNTKSGGLTKLLGPLTALTTNPSSDGSRIAYSYISNATSFNVENIKTKTISPILPTTLAEKCAWSVKKASILYCGTPLGGVGVGEPDDWYQGVTHFTDQLWKFNVDTGVAELLAEPKKTFNQNLDVINPAVSPNEDYLLFMNKTDLSLWALKLD